MEAILLMLREVNPISIAVRIVLSVIIGGLIGLERGMKNRPAGLRTYMVVCLGACLVMLTNHYVYTVYGTGDPVRMGAQVVSGIGFLGAGTIVVTRRSQIKGLTTAAGLWTAAGVGLALGIGFYEAALAGAVGVFFVMTLMQGLDTRVHQKAKALEVYFELAKEVTLGDFFRTAQEHGMEVTDIQREGTGENGARGYIATMKVQKRRNLVEFSDELRDLPGIVFLECM